MNAIDIKELKKTYESGQKALKGIDLEIPQKSFFGLLGPNGAGKTTTIGILTGLVNKTSGSTKIMGHDTVTAYKESRKLLGLSPQEINLDVFFTIREILIFQGGYYGLPKNIAKENADRFLDKLGLYHKRNSKARELSGGMKRRVQIAKALVHDPPIIILDEPTAGVDIELRHMLWEYLHDINKDGKTILLTTHYIEEAEKLCDNIAIIDNGQIIRRGSTNSIIKESSINTIKIDVEDASNIILDKNYNYSIKNNTILIKTKKVHQNLTEIINNIEKTSSIKDLKIINSSLEDAFLNLTLTDNHE